VSHTDELKEVLQNMQDECYSRGEITAIYGSIGQLNPSDNSIQMIVCSGLVTEREEGIYYNPEKEVFFSMENYERQSGAIKRVFQSPEKCSSFYLKV
jgi:hypothetical protein